MDNLFQAKKFIQRALDAEHVDVIRENLKLIGSWLKSLRRDGSRTAGARERPPLPSETSLTTGL